MLGLRGKERGHDLSGPFSSAPDAETGVGPYRFSMSHQLRPRDWPRGGGGQGRGGRGVRSSFGYSAHGPQRLQQTRKCC